MGDLAVPFAVGSLPARAFNQYLRGMAESDSNPDARASNLLNSLGLYSAIAFEEHLASVRIHYMKNLKDEFSYRRQVFGKA